MHNMLDVLFNAD